MRGIKTTKSRLRKIIFTEVAKMAFEGWDEKKFENLPYKIIQGDVAQYRDSVFVEREVVAERLRAAMGVSLRDFNDFASICEGVDESLVDEKYYEPPLIDIIKFACNRCPENRIFVMRRPDGMFMGTGHIARSPFNRSWGAVGMYTAPGFRRTGVGRSMILFLTEITKEMGLTPICGCYCQNHASRRTLESCGYASRTRYLNLYFEEKL